MKFTIETKKSKEEILQILNQNTSKQKSVFFRNFDEFFSGKISGDSFKIQQNINYRNSFRPVLIGHIEQSGDICKIHVSTRLIIPVIVLMTVWFTGIIFGCLVTPFAGFPMPHALIPYLMLAGGILLITLPRRIEEKKAKAKLEELLK